MFKLSVPLHSDIGTSDLNLPSDFVLQILDFPLHVTLSPMQTLTRDQVRQVDRLAIEELGIPGVVLMENAGREVAMAVLDTLEADLQVFAGDARVAVLCGGGNNGGDGYVVARHLANQGVNVTAWAAVDPATLTGDAAIQAAIADKMGLIEPMHTTEQLLGAQERLLEAHVLVDALLGTGFHGEVRPHIAQVIEIANQCKERGAMIVAVDVPSGLDCDTGEPAHAVVLADVTVTFVAPKRGFAHPQAELYVGRLIVGDIGAPPGLIRKVIAGGI